MAQAALAADPLAVAPLIVVAVEVEAIAVGTKRVASGIIAALQAGEGVFISGVMTELDGAQCPQVVVDKEQDLVEALAGIADEFTDSEVRETSAQMVEAGDGLEVIVPVGGDEGTGDGPQGKEPIVDDIEASGLVAKVVCASRGRDLVGVVRSRLIGASVEDVGGFRISGSNEAAVVCTSLGVAVALFLARFLGGAGAPIRREKTGSTLVTTAHPGTGCYQLAVSGETYASVRWITREG